MCTEKKAPQVPKALENAEWKGACGILVPIFNEVVLLFVGSAQDCFSYYRDAKSEGIERKLAKLRLAESVPNELGATVWDGASAMIVLPKLDMSDEACVSTLYHEALHVAMLTINRIGIEIGSYGEILAYLQQYIVKSLLYELKVGRYGTLLPDGTRVNAAKDAPKNTELELALSSGKRSRDACADVAEPRHA